MDSGHTGYILVCMALVNLMTPGLAFFYGGLVRSSSVLTIMICVRLHGLGDHHLGRLGILSVLRYV